MRKNLFYFGLGVLCMFTFGLTVALVDNSREYKVTDTTDHSVTLRTVEGAEITVLLENVPAVSCFERGAIWIIEY